MDIVKYILPVGLGVGAAFLVWRMTRGTTTAGTTDTSGTSGMRGITQGPGYAYRSISQTMISQGLQRQAFRR